MLPDGKVAELPSGAHLALAAAGRDVCPGHHGAGVSVHGAPHSGQRGEPTARLRFSAGGSGDGGSGSDGHPEWPSSWFFRKWEESRPFLSFS